MLREIKHVRQIEGEGYRRWFTDDYFDLYIWYEHKNIIGFQLCYDTDGVNEHSLTWRNDKGFIHNKIDVGEMDPSENSTPILVADGLFPKNKIADRFQQECSDIDENIAKYVYSVLLEYPS